MSEFVGDAEKIRESPTFAIIQNRAVDAALRARSEHLEDVYKPALTALQDRVKRLVEYREYVLTLEQLAQYDDALRAHRVLPEPVVGLGWDQPLVPDAIEIVPEQITRNRFVNTKHEFAPARVVRALREMGSASPSEIARFCRVKQRHLTPLNPNTLKSALKMLVTKRILERKNGIYRIIGDLPKK